MTYTVNKTNGGVLATILDGTTNTDTGLTLIGRNYQGYGIVQNENFVRLLENFADSVPPTENGAFAPIVGTLWWDTGNQRLKIYNGTSFVAVSPITDSVTAPTSNRIGDLWFDTANQQLNVWNGTDFKLIGPAYSVGQGKSGEFVETFTDNTGNTHTVVVEYVNGSVVSISSHDNFLLAATTYGFDVITSGINLPGNKVIQGNVSVGGYGEFNADTTINGQLIISPLNGLTPVPGSGIIAGTTNIYDIGTPVKNFRSLYLGGSLVLTDANIYFSNKSLVIQNKNLDGGLDVFVNSSVSGNTRVLSVNGQTGLASVANDPTVSMGIATKNYTDNSIAAANNTLSTAINQTNADLAALASTVNVDVAGLTTLINTNVNQINANDATTNDSLTQLTSRVNRDEISNNSNIANIYSTYDSVNSTVRTLAPINSPAFTGTPTATVSIADGDNTTRLATTAFVTKGIGALSTTLSTDYNIKINTLSGSTTSSLALKANINSPAFTGNPTAQTPTTGDNSTRLATTAFVNVLTVDYNAKFVSAASDTATNLANGLALKANINSPIFTGTPTAPTPTTGDNSTNLATTAFVAGAVGAQKFNYTVSTNVPTGGNNGDFWFQIG